MAQNNPTIEDLLLAATQTSGRSTYLANSGILAQALLCRLYKHSVSSDFDIIAN